MVAGYDPVTHTAAPPFAHTAGRKDAKVVLVGDFWGKEDALTGMPFMGSSGQELNRMLKDAGLPRRDLLLTNVLALRPEGKDLESLCVKRAEVGEGYSLPPIAQGKYLHPDYTPELDRLRDELLAHPRNLVVALGNTACWALLRSTRISALRGTTTLAALAPGLKVLPTFHPSAVLRQWALRPVVMADLLKASRESAYPEIRRPERRVLINPTLRELRVWVDGVVQSPPATLAVDIETYGGQITMIGFAPSPREAVVFPFVNFLAEGHNYWPSLVDEVAAWDLVAQLLHSPIPKVFQNGLFDLGYLYRMGFRPRACVEDTMLLHHSIYPEMQKGLGFLGSCYTDESAWKLLRSKTDMNKRDE